MSVVSSREELSLAKERGDPEITVTGDLADKLKKSKKITLLGAGTLTVIAAALGVATVAAPVTGGVSYLMAVPVVTLSGMELAAVITAAALGIGFLIAIFKDYEEISYSAGNLVLKKRSA